MTYRGLIRVILLPAFLTLIIIACSGPSTTPNPNPNPNPGTNPTPVDGVVTGDYTVGSQADVDTLVGVTRVDGSLSLPNIANLNLDALNSIEEITGDLTFGTKVSDAAASARFDNFETKPGQAPLAQDVGLVDDFTYTGWDNLKTVNGDLTFSQIHGLTSIGGFSGLGYVEGGIYITENYDLACIESTFLDYNYSADGLTLKVGIIDISGNDELTCIDGFNGVATIGIRLTFRENPDLTSIDGFSTTQTEEDNSRADLKIVGNRNLTTIDGFNALENVAEDFEITENRALGSISGFNALKEVGGIFGFVDNPVLASIPGFNALKEVGGAFEITENSALGSISGFNALKEVGGAFEITENSALGSISGFNALKEVGGAFEITENSALGSISGFDVLENVAGEFLIGGNPVLASIPEFNALKEVGGEFLIGGNPVLASIPEFNALKEVGGVFAIGDNPVLASIDGFYTLENVAGFNISSNNVNLKIICPSFQKLPPLNRPTCVGLGASLTVSPTTSTVTVGDPAVEFTATLTDSTDTITWSLTGEGSIPANSTGITVSYTPPATGGASTATLTATAGNLSDSATITIDALPTNPTLTVTPETSTVTVGDPSVTFTANLTDSTDTINWTLTGEGSIPENSTGSTVSYTPPATGDASTATLTATAGNLSDSATITIDAAETPSITSVSIRGVTGSTQVRQGAGAIILEVTGTKLLGITDADLAGLAGTLEADATDTTAAISFTIPAGASLGAQILTLTLPSATISQESAVTVTKITSGPAGSDTDRGTTDSPFRTLKMAISVATANSGDLIFLQDGSYSTASGESFPQSVNGISIEGESQAGVMIDGTGAADNSNGLDLSGVSSLSKLTVQNFDGPLDPAEFVNFKGNGIMVAGGTATFSEVTSTLNNNGFQIEGGSATVSSSSFTNNSYFGVSAKTDSTTVGTLMMTDSSVTGNGKVVQGVIVAGINVDTLGELDLDNVTVSDNGQNGVSIGNTGAGADSIKLRNSSITNHTGGNGFAIGGASTLIDLGKPASTGTAEAGNNTIKDVGDNQAHFSINDSRTSTQGAGVELWAFGNDLGGTGDPETGIKTGPDSSQKRYNISAAGNIINFGP